MLEQLKYLIEYQILENKRSQIVRCAEETPRRIQEMEREFGTFESDVLSKKAELEHSQKMQRTIEQNVADLEAKINRSKNRMAEVKNNKEYQAILKEIQEIKKEISTREEENLGIMEKIETLGKEIEGLEGELQARRKVFEETKQQLLEEDAKFQERLTMLESFRSEVRERLKPELVRRSEFLFQRQDGIAVAAVENGVCQVCHLNIPPQKFIELQRDETIHQCPSCHRFIYWPGHEGYCFTEDDVAEV